MGVIIKQYEGSLVSPKDDAVMHEIFNDQSGVIRGCEITYMGLNKVRISEGYIYLCGRTVQITEENIISPLSEKGDEGEVILRIDLLSETPGKVIARVPREDLVQGDLNGENSVYELLLATYTVNSNTITDLTTQYEMISAGFSKDKILEKLDDIKNVTEKGFLVDALAIKKQIQNLCADNGTEFRFGVNEKGEYGYIVGQDGADTVIPFSGKYKSQIIGALQNTNLELTEESSWEEIVDGIYSLFPEQLDVLAYLGIKNLSISGSTRDGAGKWHYKNSGKFDITHFNTLTYVLSLSSSSENGLANCYLYYEGGSLNMKSGSEEIDVSECKGEAYFRVGQSQIYHSNGDYTSGGSASLTSAKLHV